MSTGEQLRAALAEVDCLNADIAELVALLRRGKALYVAGVGSGSLRQQGCVDDARVDEATARLILDGYDAAIAKHGGAA